MLRQTPILRKSHEVHRTVRHQPDGSADRSLAPSASAQSSPTIAGDTMGKKSLAKAPNTLAEMESLKKTPLFSDDDVRYLRTSKAI